MTNNLKLYILFSLLWSIVFFAALNWGTAESSSRWPYITLSAVIYGSGFALVGYILGKQDDQSKARYSLEHAYSATSQIVSVTVGAIWIIFFRPQQSWFLLMYIPFFALLAILGYINYKKSIKGMDKKELFK
jgi:hypothetical protein